MVFAGAILNRAVLKSQHNYRRVNVVEKPTGSRGRNSESALYPFIRVVSEKIKRKKKEKELQTKPRKPRKKEVALRRCKVASTIPRKERDGMK